MNGALALATSLSFLATSIASAAPASATDLVDPTTLAPGIVLEMRYAMADNFLHEAVYPCARCLLARAAAERLARAEEDVERQGLHLKLWDCYRPPAVQRRMWALMPDTRFVADPRKGSNHSRGGAVDVTLVDATGKELAMPTPHDAFTDAARADAPASPEAATNRATLRSAMEAEGFTALRTEWWHFDAKGSRAWPLRDEALCDQE